LKNQINRIFIIPVLFIVFGIVTFSVFYFFFVDDVTKKEFKKVNDGIINYEKRILKSSLDSIVDGVEEIRNTGYESTEKLLKEFLKLYKKEYFHTQEQNRCFFKKHSSSDIFVYIISESLTHPDIHQNYIHVGPKKYLVTVYKGKKYLSVEEKFDGKTFGLAFSIDVLEKQIKKEIIDYIKNVNLKYSNSYVLIGRIDPDYEHKKFGEIIYNPLMPNSSKVAIGKDYYKKIYKCIQNKTSCFVLYKMNDDIAINSKCNKMLAYVKIYKPYNWFFIKGFYYSQILGEIENIQEDIIEDATEIFIGTMILLFVFTYISFFVAYKISKRIMQQVIQSYDRLRINYEISKNELIKRYYTDTLTHLPNMNKLIEDVKDYKSLILLDIDDFSDINDIYGFEYGDRVLLRVRDALKEKFTNVYRIGSDTFAILLDREVSQKDLLDLLNYPIFYDNIKISFTLGASNSKGKLLETAECALKSTLKNSTNKFKLYDEEITKIQKDKLEKLQKIYKILEKNAILPFYQCIVDKNGKIIKYEALMRINDNGKILLPNEFLELTKHAKIYPLFSSVMIEKVFADLEKFDKPVAVNLSFEDIANSELRNKILTLLDKKPENKTIVFEILESESIKDFDLVVEFIQNVKEKGAKIAIDDFGTGYSNFINVLQLYPDYIKIDQSLVQNIKIEKYKEIIKLITEFAHKFNIITTAEFVHSKEIFEELLKIGVDEFQGYYFCEPKPIDELKE